MIPALDQKARCAYIRYLDELLDSRFGEAVQSRRAESLAEYLELSEEQRRGHLAWRRELRAKLDAVLNEACPGVDPECCDVSEE
jgi:hypothetical protein